MGVVGKGENRRREGRELKANEEGRKIPFFIVLMRGSRLVLQGLLREHLKGI